MKDILKALSIFLGLIGISMVTGCAAISTMVGHSEPDPTKIQAGDTRDQAESVLGKRLWRPGSADGLTCDIYEYEVEQPADPASGALMLVLDVLSGGAPEFLALAGKNLTREQVVVAYDEQDRVRFVSKPWTVDGTVSQCSRRRSLLPADSGVCSTARPSPMDQPAGAASGVTVLELDRGVRAWVDGRKTEGRVVKLSPGHHTLNYPYGVSAEVELFPGRLYCLKTEEHSSADLFWIEDVQSGETLRCDWPAPHHH
ncbi:MAG TPA: hypothetical protein VEG37_10100 [Burkholderiales bacterium]|nr:hypothetical protein [Burkholderiales bacterium]